ncbi:murein hydrolase activator EnvC family protein [Microvirga massiliensis]|uniref:murein hydrolase activator EnvC family protein n=1 Tax=Microvirga massiliensis TaxID=1033741 RepID=UPI00062B6E10|nr:peptidoglycan DD-metalloendopeptidase family protein [Microvirga massiliensis]
MKAVRPLPVLLVLAGLAGPALAQVAPAETPASVEATAEEKARREQELKSLEEALANNEEARARLEKELAGIRGDRTRLNQALIDAAARAQEAEERIRALEQRLTTLSASETAIRRSLESRRGVIAEVFAALQRMGRKQPPAVLVRPEDMLAAVRASILLGAVLPELRAETETLAVDLGELVRLKEAINTDRVTLRTEIAGLLEEQQRLTGLMDERQEQLQEIERSMGSERERAAELARQTGSLKELITRMEHEIAAARQAAEEARKAAEAQAAAVRERFAQAAFRDPARLAPKIPFVEARGLLPKPVSGEVVREFGASDGYGGTTRGVSFVTRPKSVVVSPTDGWVVFAGPFRSYGRLLIINAGGGYHLLLAGMERIAVEVGQFVLAGEPVATMGQASPVSPAAGALETTEPVLYVEFRKDGGSIDPGPWWAKPHSEKVRG